MARRARMVPLTQGLYYILTGLWSLVSIRTFERVTGPKVDRWLVKTVGTLLIVDGAVLTLGARRRRPLPEITLLSTGTALGMAAIDITYVLRGRISPVYLLDAVAEMGVVSCEL